jgi:DNA polymerase
MLAAMSQSVETAALSRAEAASLLRWWLDAGVDVGIAEEPRNWLKEKETSSPLPLPGTAEAQSDGGEPNEPNSRPSLPPAPSGSGSLPPTLDAFHAWLAESATLPLFRAGAARALPHGSANAEIMLVAGIPSPEDAAEGKPIGGAAWALAVRMLAAIGFTPDQAYVAALSCFSGAGSRLSAAEQEHCRDSLFHQIRLVGPKRLLLLGEGPARLLLGSGLLAARGKVHRVAGIPAVVTFPPSHLLGRVGDKPLAWRDLLLLMGEPL